jgi:hypothetical protein
MRWALAAFVAAVGGLTAHTVVNARRLRRPAPSAVDEPVSVLLPVRDEAANAGPCVAALLAQNGVADLEVVVLDDGSTDGTADGVRAAAAGDDRLRLVTGPPPPDGWLGKPHACAELAATARPESTVLVFVDADVRLTPGAVAAAVAELRRAGVGLLSPYPRIRTGTVGERLVQPLLQWSWLTFLPLRAMERSPRPSLAAAGGQFLVVDRAAYTAAGGHAAVRGDVLEDLALARAVKRSGGRIALADGSRLAECRMYTSWRELADGYGKSLWASFGSPAGAVAVVGALGVLYVAPPLLALAGAATGNRRLAGAGTAAYLLGVAGRVVSARATGGRAWPDALAHPVSVTVFAGLVARSYRLRRQGALRWRGRAVEVGAEARR